MLQRAWLSPIQCSTVSQLWPPAVGPPCSWLLGHLGLPRPLPPGGLSRLPGSALRTFPTRTQPLSHTLWPTTLHTLFLHVPNPPGQGVSRRYLGLYTELSITSPAPPFSAKEMEARERRCRQLRENPESALCRSYYAALPFTSFSSALAPSCFLILSDFSNPRAWGA